MTDDIAVPRPRARGKAALLELLDNLDQAPIAADLTTFFGPHSEVYLDTYEKMRQASGARRTMPRTWSWPVFLGSFTWFFYRKMYAYGALLIIAPMIVGYLLGSAGGALSIVFAIWAKGFYVNYALNRRRTHRLSATGRRGIASGRHFRRIDLCELAGVDHTRRHHETHRRPLMKFIVLLAAIAPPLLLLSYGIGKARASWRSEAIWNAFLIGAVSALALVTIELGLAHLLPLERAGPVAEAAFKSVLIAAIPEEAVKFFVLVYLVEKQVDVRRLQDRLVLALAVSLGFATLENFGYAVAAGGLTMVAALRAITAVPGHAIDGLAMGALLIRARLSGRAEDLRAALIVPVVLHAFYDFPLMALQKQGDVAKEWFSVMWLATIAASAALVIPLCNRMLAKAVDFDSAAGRDQSSTEVASWLIAGGAIVLIAGPLLAAWTYRASGAEVVSVAAALSIFPLAFGIDAIRSGVKQRRRRLAAVDQTFDCVS